MLIANIIQCTNLGGMEKASLRLMVGLQRHGHICRLLSLNPLGNLEPLLHENDIQAVGLNYRGPSGFLSLREYRKALSSELAASDAVIMTGHNLMAMIGLGSFCRGHRVLAIHFHHEGVKSPWTWRAIYWLAKMRFRAVTFPSDFVRDEAEKLFPPIAKISHTIRNPVQLPDESHPGNIAAARGRLGLPQAAPIIGNAGWLIPRKRWDVYLQVAQRIIDRVPEAVFLIAGDGPMRQELCRQADELGLGGRLRWLGWREDLADFYRSIDVLLFHSDWDAFPTTPQEAMTYGTPVVASVVNGGLKEIFAQYQPGFLTGRHDVVRLADEVVRLICDRELASACGRSGREAMQTLGDVDSITQQYETLLST